MQRGLHLDPGHAHVGSAGSAIVFSSPAAQLAWEGWWGEVGHKKEMAKRAYGDDRRLIKRGWRPGARRDLQHLLPLLARGR